MRKKVRIILLSAICFSQFVFGQGKMITVLPIPSHIRPDVGVLTLKSKIVIGISDKSLFPAAQYLQSLLPNTVISKVVKGRGDICLQLETRKQKEGAYNLNVSAKNVVAKSSDYQGIIAAIATFSQLLPEDAYLESQSSIRIPMVNICDEPRFPWRGLMLDASRHFWNKEEVKRVLDMMALYKLNKFHWHLTDDPGWRIEIKKYPLLTEKGAWRKFNFQDRECMRLAAVQNNPDFLIPEDKLRIAGKDTLYGGFYTQEDIKEVVAYATQRSIEVIPEIDMPGHFLSAISQYPDVTCGGLMGWGHTYSSPVCPGKDSSLEFCKNIYKEIFALFPSKYVHLGADEVEKTNWKKCPDCQSRIKKEGLASEEALQAWFVRKMEQFFKENGKRLIGWDEVVGDGLSREAVIMWWRDWEKGAVPSALAQGKDVVLSPTTCFYFDYQPDKNTLKNILDFNPFAEASDPVRQTQILGVQANVWTEYIPSMKRVEYMMMPRMIALSQVAWSKPDRKMSTPEFEKALVPQISRINRMNVNYRIPDLEGFYDVNASVDESNLRINCPLPNVEIRYTTDGTIPTKSSPLYTGNLCVAKTTNFRFRSFRPNGSGCDVVNTTFVCEPYAETLSGISPQSSGLLAFWYDFKGNGCANIETAPKKGEYVVEDVCIPSGVKGNIGLILKGYLQVPDDDIYTFAVSSDDGSTLALDGKILVDNDGSHSTREIIAQKALRKGLHAMEVRYFDSNGGMLQVFLVNKHGEKIPMPKDWFKH